MAEEVDKKLLDRLAHINAAACHASAARRAEC